MTSDSQVPHPEPRPVDHGICPACGYVMLPVLPLSPCGHNDDPVISPLTEPGFVYSWTQLRTGEDVRTIVMADFLGGKLRVTAPFGGVGVEIGDRVWLRCGDDTPYVMVRGGG